MSTPPVNRFKPELVFLGVTLASISVIGFVIYSSKNQQIQKTKLESIEQNQSLNDQSQEKDSTTANSILEDEQEAKAQIKLYQLAVIFEKQLTETKENCAGDESRGIRCFLAGKITNNDPAYKDKPLYLEVDNTLGSLGIRHYILENKNDGTVYRAYAESIQDDWQSTIIPGVNDLPEEISLPQNQYLLEKHGSPFILFSEAKANQQKVIFHNNQLGDFYLTEEGCLIAELPDHSAIAYNPVLPFVNGESKVIDVTFNDGNKNQEEYEYTNHSCRQLCTSLIEADATLRPGSLEVIGKTTNGEKFYRFKDPGDPALKALYQDKNTLPYYDENFEKKETNKYSYAEFIKLNPYLFWQDPLGRWIRFTNSKFVIAAEMCKPVLYLYPKTKLGLNIQLKLNGKLTHTDPLYNEKWNIETTPESQITDLNTGKSYGYLFWEGIGLNYPEPKNGWVVSPKNLEQFFDEKLKVLGLNQKEATDFKEYWIPRLNDRPYYQISFLSQSQFEDLAQINFNPFEPNIFIRVMMTAKGLDHYLDIPQQTLSQAPKRTGFTAVEWGGALLK